MNRNTQKILATVFIISEVIIFFFFPVVWCKKANEDIVFFSMFELAMTSVITIDYATVTSSFHIDILLPYAAFIYAMVLLRSDKNFRYKKAAIIGLIIFSFVYLLLFAPGSSVWDSSLMRLYKSIEKFDDESWLFIYLAFCIFAIVYVAICKIDNYETEPSPSSLYEASEPTVEEIKEESVNSVVCDISLKNEATSHEEKDIENL